MECRIFKNRGKELHVNHGDRLLRPTVEYLEAEEKDCSVSNGYWKHMKETGVFQKDNWPTLEYLEAPREATAVF